MYDWCANSTYRYTNPYESVYRNVYMVCLLCTSVYIFSYGCTDKTCVYVYMWLCISV